MDNIWKLFFIINTWKPVTFFACSPWRKGGSFRECDKVSLAETSPHSWHLFLLSYDRVKREYDLRNLNNVFRLHIILAFVSCWKHSVLSKSLFPHLYQKIYYYDFKLFLTENSNNLKTILRFSKALLSNVKIPFFNRDGAPACKFPDLDILNPEIMKFIKEVKPLNCKPADWVAVEGSKLQITKSAKELNGQITCAFSGKLLLQ